MPATFFAHQVVVLPVARRWPTKTDGVALVIGSMAPDFAYVMNGSRFSLWAHGFPGVVLFCVPITLVVSWIVVRILAPVVPDHMPQLWSFRLRDYRGLATHRFRLITSAFWALIGALSHVALDHFTHDWGWFARHVNWYDAVLIDGDWMGRSWTAFRVVQYAGHLGGTALGIWLLWRYGRAGWMTARAHAVTVFPATLTTAFILWTTTAVGCLVALGWVLGDRMGSATDVVRVTMGAFLGMTTGAIALRWTFRSVNEGKASDDRMRGTPAVVRGGR